MEASQYHATETLRNGLAVTIRAIRPDDLGRLLDAYRGLSPDSIYTRFFHNRGDLLESEAKAAVEVDFEREVALVAAAGKGGKERLVGGGRYHLLDRPVPAERCAEVAFLVAEEARGQGLAGRLLHHLAGIALGQGIRSLEAEMLPQNRAMRAVFERSGFPVERRTEEGVVHLTLRLHTAPDTLDPDQT